MSTDWTHRLRLRNLQTLLSLAQTGNMSQTAEALNTTQPGLSKWLRELEEDIGLPLFERHARGLRPTPYGQALIDHARRIEAHLDTARDEMLLLREGGNYVESNSATLTTTLLLHSDMIGVTSQRPALRYSRLKLLRLLPLNLGVFGSISLYWRSDAVDRIAVKTAIDCIREVVYEFQDTRDHYA